jgi:hypothetical protein
MFIGGRVYDAAATVINDKRSAATTLRAVAICGAAIVGANVWASSRNGAKLTAIWKRPWHLCSLIQKFFLCFHSLILISLKKIIR